MKSVYRDGILHLGIPINHSDVLRRSIKEHFKSKKTTASQTKKGSNVIRVSESDPSHKSNKIPLVAFALTLELIFFASSDI